MRRWLGTAAAVLLLGLGSALAGATQDLRIEEREDKKRNTVYELRNLGSRAITAEVEMRKDCTRTKKNPPVKSVYVAPGQKVVLAKAWRETRCRHEYRVLRARYH